jgi:hypothetical protein
MSTKPGISSRAGVSLSEWKVMGSMAAYSEQTAE